MRLFSRRRTIGAVAAAGLVAALVVPATSIGSGSKAFSPPTKIGKGEGRLNVIEWPAYTDKSFAKPFEAATGCKIHRQDAGSSNQMVALMRSGGGGGGGQYDLVSASGDASLRLIYGKDVVPININLIPSWKDFLPFFKSPAHNTVGGLHYGVSLQWGPNTLLYNSKQVKPAPTSWSVIYGKKYRGKVSIPNNPIQIADAALYLMTSQPALGIRDPYELTKAQFDATVALLKRQKPSIKRYWNYAADQIQDFKTNDAVVGATWPYQTLTLQAAKVPVKDLIPKEGATGWADTWMLAAKAPHPNCAYMWMKYVTTPKVEAKQAIVFGETPVNPLACPFMNKLQAGSCTQYHLNAPASYFKSIHYWKTPIGDCGWGGRKDCVDFTAWQQAWTQITG
jgi:putative spermidine/putrescine transport system substrate-binding protein